MRGTGDARRASQVRGGAAYPGSHALRAVVLCLLALIPSRATEAYDITEPAGQQGETSQDRYGFEIGPTFSLLLPVASAHRDEVGLAAGLSFTGESTSLVGVGADVAYHYWPVSAEFKQEFNELLRKQTLNTLELGGETWGLQVVQFGWHIRFAAPISGPRPWLQVGGSVYLVDPNTSGYSGDAGFFTVTAPPLKRTKHFGGSVAVGADLVGGPRARVGLDATYHFVNCIEHYGENLHVFTVGGHALFGW
jgi:hypothetical protein